MILFFQKDINTFYILQITNAADSLTKEKLTWLFSGGKFVDSTSVEGPFIGPRKEMITPWSTNAVEITQNMGISGVARIEEFVRKEAYPGEFDPMLKAVYAVIDQDVFTISHVPDPIVEVDNIKAYSEKEGLALSQEEIDYLESVSTSLGRKLTDSEVFGFSQVNSEHCRHKIFNGTFIIDGQEKPDTLFQLIKKTSKANPGFLVSAYKDNVAFIEGPSIEQFAPARQDQPDYFEAKTRKSVLSLKAETHNFPTTVEPFNGAATGSGGEIRDRMAGGQGSFPLAGTAVYMTSYSRLSSNRPWENHSPERPWLYQTPSQILIKASNGASDYGNKFGQPLITGSLLTFEHEENGKAHGFDKVIMQAGGVGFGIKDQSQKKSVEKGDKIVVLGGDNYRIGMGGGAVSSVATGEFGNSIELNAVQRSNPEMQKRVANTIRALAELDENPISSVHDHGAGGHLNCLSELVEETGGKFEISKFPVGDPTLSDKEIISNESQERMGLALHEKHLDYLRKVADRERSPMYVVGEASGDHKLTFTNKEGKRPVDFELTHLFGSSPKTILEDKEEKSSFQPIQTSTTKVEEYLLKVLKMEAVASKDWLTNKVDRCVTGKVAKQQTCGELQIPLNNLGIMALDFGSNKGVGTSIGHAPVPALIDEKAGSRLAIAESLTNLVWAPLEGGIKGVSLSANWMWPAKNKGENARLYNAVQAVSDYACELGVNIPTGKDSLSMTQKYPGKTVYSPGTVIISAIGQVTDIRKTIEPVAKVVDGSKLIYLNLGSKGFELGGSTLGQVLNRLGDTTPDAAEADYFLKAFSLMQLLISEGLIIAGHDVSSGGLVTTLLEMCFPSASVGMKVNLDGLNEPDAVKVLFSENPGLVVQTTDAARLETIFTETGINCSVIGEVTSKPTLEISLGSDSWTFDVTQMRKEWAETSWLLDKKQTKEGFADTRYSNLGKQPLKINLPGQFGGNLSDYGLSFTRPKTTGIKAAIIREQGNNSDREMAYCMWLAGFDVKDVHMTDLISGREDLSEVNLIVFVGGFSNSDVLGSAKGWAGSFLYNDKAKKALDNFYAREDTLSLGVCNGCQLAMELGLIYPELDNHPKMHHNTSGKFECTFTDVEILENNSVMFGSLAGSRLGIWSAHGEGQFVFAEPEKINIAAKFAYSSYPANPNGSQFDTACVVSNNGRHAAIMPHLERSMFPWNWGYYPDGRKSDEVTPWMEAFVNARKWVEEMIGKD
jgi:phosphoribosylformylglycinamidine synthase